MKSINREVVKSRRSQTVFLFVTILILLGVGTQFMLLECSFIFFTTQNYYDFTRIIAVDFETTIF